MMAQNRMAQTSERNYAEWPREDGYKKLQVHAQVTDELRGNPISMLVYALTNFHIGSHSLHAAARILSHS